MCEFVSGGPLYAKEEIDPMFWKESIPTPGEFHNRGISGPQVGCHVVPSKLLPKTQSEKFCYALSLSKQICSSMAECGSIQFMERNQQLKGLFELWSAGKEAQIVDKANFSGKFNGIFMLIM